MADVKMPKSVPCQFDAKGWAPCKKPSTNGWCSKHEKVTCVSCGKHATKSCDAQMGGLGCGEDLCDDCRHSYAAGAAHVTKAVDEARRKKEREEKTARVASRTSPVQRMNEELGVPATLFELLKGDWRKEYELKTLYFLELKHGLMGFFPAIFSSDITRIVLTTDLQLLERVWQKLEPRDARLRAQVAYVNETLGIAYMETEPSFREQQEPQRMLTAAEFDHLVGKDGESPYRWAFGLIGGGKSNKEHFTRSLIAQASGFEPSFRSAALSA